MASSSPGDNFNPGDGDHVPGGGNGGLVRNGEEKEAGEVEKDCNKVSQTNQVKLLFGGASDPKVGASHDIGKADLECSNDDIERSAIKEYEWEHVRRKFNKMGKGQNKKEISEYIMGGKTYRTRADNITKSGLLEYTGRQGDSQHHNTNSRWTGYVSALNIILRRT